MFLCCFWLFHSIQQRNRREFLARAPETAALKGENDKNKNETEKWLCSLGLRSGGAGSDNAGMCVVTTSAKRGKLVFCGFVCVTLAYSELILRSGTTAASAILCFVGLCTFCERQHKFREAAPVFQKGRQVGRLLQSTSNTCRDFLFTSPSCNSV